MSEMNTTQKNAIALLKELAEYRAEIERLSALEPVLQAAAKGKTIQVRTTNLPTWVDCEILEFDDSVDMYRVKPEVVRTKRYWVRSHTRPVIWIVSEADQAAMPREGTSGFVSWIDTEWQEHEVPTQPETSQ